jgi:hypothetical protein
MLPMPGGKGDMAALHYPTGGKDIGMVDFRSRDGGKQ